MKNNKDAMPKFKSFNEFFEYYLEEHSDRRTKIVHVAGTLSGIAFFIYCLVDHRPLWIPFSLVIAYLINWSSHIFIEHNTPVTFRAKRLWAIAADLRMVALILVGKIKI